MKSQTVACLGSGSGEKGELMYDAMYEVGKLLAKADVTVLTGGFGGAGMEAPVRGALEFGGESIGYTMMGIPGNQYLSRVVDCGKNDDFPEVQFGMRLGNLMTADAFILGAGGGTGTFLELMTIINFNKKAWRTKKAVVILKPSTTIFGWDLNMLEQLRNWGLLSDAAEIYIAKSPQEAVDYVLS